FSATYRSRRLALLTATPIVAVVVNNGLLSAPQSGVSKPFSARVIGITDGDTVTVLVSNRPLKVRLDGIDCPERGQPFGRVARTFTSTRVFGRTVEVLPRDRDRYGRLVARIRADGADLGLELLSAGLAWHYTQYSNDRAYTAAERAARAARTGLWSQKEPVPPWVQRRQHAPSPAPRSPKALASQSAGPFHGNVKSMVFHRPGCRNYDCRQCTAIFATREDARSHGFRPAGDCAR
ncbi:MAG TPA: thermonuclease family protein, partial [Vicinamibacterales bacterium]